jgi:dolichol-phosphate mannosyltransferase
MSESTTLVIIPTFNEAENISSITSRLRVSVPEADVLIVDDSSPDGTGDIADSIAGQDPHVHVLHRTEKTGLGTAYVAGFQWGLDDGYEVLVQMDADGSHQPEELPGLLEALSCADMVKGSRYIPGGQMKDWPWLRQLVSRAGGLWIRLLLGIECRDITGGFNAFHAQTLRTILPHLSSQGYNIQTDLTWNVISAGMTVRETPITFINRQHGKSKMNLKIGIESLIKTTRWGLKHRFRGQHSGVSSSQSL